jgi:hypothetical protein
MTSWRYIPTREVSHGEEVWFVREIYTDPDGSLSWTKDPVLPFGTSLASLKRDLAMMAADLERGDFLDMTLDPPRLVEVPE